MTQRWAHQLVDSDGLAGFQREQQSLDGGSMVASTIHAPTVVQTAIRSTPVAGGQDITAHMVTETDTRGRAWINASTSWRWTDTQTSFDSYGLPTDVRNYGDITANLGDDACTHTDYARDPSNYLINYASQVVTTDCNPSPGDGDYSATVGAAPTQGLATKTLALADVSNGTKTWKQAARADFDPNGRPVASYDALDRKTITAYTPGSGAPVTSVAVTNPMQWTTTTTVDPGLALPTKTVDVNGKTTVETYDPLGRLAQVWLNNRSTTAPPDIAYTYTLSNTAPNVVQTQKLGPASNCQWVRLP